MASIEQIEQAIEALRRSADLLDAGLPGIKSELAAGVASKAKLEKTTSMLIEAEATLSTVTASLGGIEDAVLNSMQAAKDMLHDPSVSLETRMQMLRLCKGVFSKFDAAGFKIAVPEIGSQIDSEIHNVKGKAKSALGKNEIADVISWGYRFPSGKGQLAEVLVGDGSVKEETEEAPKSRPAATKAGIAMVLDEAPEPAQPKPTKPGGGLFEQLAEAAERNRDTP